MKLNEAGKKPPFDSKTLKLFKHVEKAEKEMMDAFRQVAKIKSLSRSHSGDIGEVYTQVRELKTDLIDAAEMDF